MLGHVSSKHVVLTHLISLLFIIIILVRGLYDSTLVALVRNEDDE